jgi:hypothetical protein
MLALLPLLGLGACASTPSAPHAELCPDGTKAMVMASLFFGRSVPGRVDLSDAEWSSFVDDVIVPAFPAGFTAFDAEGAWRNPNSHHTSREHSKVLIVALPGARDDMPAIHTVQEAYKRRFHQKSVGLTVQDVCGAF